MEGIKTTLFSLLSRQSFINHLVAPLCNSYAAAGLLPGLWQYNATSADDPTSSGKTHRFKTYKRGDHFHVSEVGKIGAKGPRKVVCLQTKHLQENYEKWAKELEESERRSKDSSDDSTTTPLANAPIEELSESTDEDSSK